MLKTIIKRDGSTEDFDPSKLNRWADWASKQDGIDIEWSEMVLDTIGSIKTEQIGSQELQRALIDRLISEDTFSSLKMAGMLFAPLLQKKIYPFGFPTIKNLHNQLIKTGLMQKMSYSDNEYEQIQSFIDHTRDFNSQYIELDYTNHKYALKDVKTKQVFETMQFVYMRMAMRISEMEYKDVRLSYVKEYYDYLSKKKISFPTPDFNNLGTPLNGYASCCVTKTGDDRFSLAVNEHILNVMTTQSAGIGTYVQTRSIGDSIKNGKMIHRGRVPYLRTIQSIVHENTQGSRGGAATAYYDCFDPEVQRIQLLKHPLTSPEERVDGINYAMNYNKFFAKKVALNEDIMLFNVYSAPDLVKAFYSSNSGLFERLYNKYENDPGFIKKYKKAREIFVNAGTQSFETGVHFECNIQEMNTHTPFKDTIHSSNLCVAPETEILTKEFGYKEIKILENQNVHVWNGEEWSETTVKKTGVNQKLLTVITDSGSVLDATLYHKWYVQNQNKFGASTDVIEKRTHELLPGDMLIKFGLDIVDHGNKILSYAYENGFYTGDGTTCGKDTPRIYLYNDKRNLIDNFSKEIINTITETGNRININCVKSSLFEKFWIPGSEYTINSRLKWLEGIVDSDGCLTNNQGCKTIQLNSVNYDFLFRLRLTLQELGIYSTIKDGIAAGLRYMPDHKGSNKQYYCKQSWRILISNDGLLRLKSLGFNPKRLDLSELKQGNRTANKFIQIKAVVDKGRFDDTYCVNEPLKNRVMFNGILTGNCLEIGLATQEYKSMQDLYSSEDVSKVVVKVIQERSVEELVFTYGGNQFISILRDDNPVKTYGSDLEVGDKLSGPNGAVTITEIIENYNPEIGLCSLGGVVISNIESLAEYKRASFLLLRKIDRTIHMSDYPLPHLEVTAKARMSAGVGIMGLATVLAKEKLSITTKQGKQRLHEIFEQHAYCLIEASLELSKEFGVAPWMHRTKWVDGWTPIQTYNKNVDKIQDFEYKFDWEDLSKRIIANGGIRNTVTTAFMPGESSSKAAGVTNSINLIKGKNLDKSDEEKTSPFAAPYSDNPNYIYEIAYDVPTRHVDEMYAIAQKFTDQAISADHYKKLNKGATVTTDEMIEGFLNRVTLGHKTKYYQNSLIGDGVELAITRDCQDGVCTL